jgi:hypothetical protein
VGWADKLRKATPTNNPSDPNPFVTATYNGDGLRVKKSDTRAGALQQHDYSYGPTGLLWDSNPNTVYTPGFGHRSNGISKFYQTDWLGSTRYVTDSTGNTATQGLRFDGFGQRIAMSGTDPYHATDVQSGGGESYTWVTVTTAWAAMPSRRPTKPMPSLVVALRLTAVGGRSRAAAMRSTMAGTWGAIFGASASRVAST